MSLEERIRKLAEDIIACVDYGKTAVVAEEIQDAVRERVIQLRTKRESMPLWRRREVG